MRACPFDPNLLTWVPQVPNSAWEDLTFPLFLLDWFKECFFVLVSLTVRLLIPMHFCMYLWTKKPGFLRITMLLVQLKIIYAIIERYSSDALPEEACKFSEYSRFGGPSDAGMQVASLFVCQLLNNIALHQTYFTNDSSSDLKRTTYW